MEAPPARALSAAEARGDVVTQRDAVLIALCRRGRLERYCNGEWSGAVTRLEWDPESRRCRGVVVHPSNPRGAWEASVLPRGADDELCAAVARLADTAEVMHNLPAPPPALPPPPADDAAVADGAAAAADADAGADAAGAGAAAAASPREAASPEPESPVHSPPRGPLSMRRMFGASVLCIPQLGLGRRGSHTALRSPRQRGGEGGGGASPPPPPPTPAPASPTVIGSPPSAALYAAQSGGRAVSFPTDTHWMMCRRGRLEKVVNGQWTQAVSDICAPHAHSRRLGIRDLAGRCGGVVLPTEGMPELLAALSALASRAGVRHDLPPAVLRGGRWTALYGAAAEEEEARRASTAQRAETPSSPMSDMVRMRRLLGETESFWPLRSNKPEPLEQQQGEEEEEEEGGAAPAAEAAEAAEADGDAAAAAAAAPAEPQTEPDEAPAPAASTPCAGGGGGDWAVAPQCVVCLDADRNTVLFPCRHLCCCAECSVRVEECPLCRSRVRHRVEVWLSC